MTYSVYHGIPYRVLVPGDDGSVIAKDVFEINPGDPVFLGSGSTIGIVSAIHEAQVPVWRLRLDIDRARFDELDRADQDDPSTVNLFLASTQVLAYEPTSARSEGGYTVQTVGEIVKTLGAAQSFMIPANSLNGMAPVKVTNDDKMARVWDIMPRGVRPVRALEVRGEDGLPGMILLANGAVIPAIGLRDPENIETISGSAVDTPNGRTLAGSAKPDLVLAAQQRADQTAAAEANALPISGIETDTPPARDPLDIDLDIADLETDTEAQARQHAVGRRKDDSALHTAPAVPEVTPEPNPNLPIKPGPAQGTPKPPRPSDEEIARRMAFVRKHVIEAADPMKKIDAAKHLGVSPSTISTYARKAEAVIRRENAKAKRDKRAARRQAA